MTHALHLTAWHPIVDDVSGMFVLEQCAALQEMGLQIGLIFSRIEGLRGLSWRRLARGVPNLVHLDNPVPTMGFKSWNFPGATRLVPTLTDRMLGNRYRAYEKRYGRPDVLHAHVALGAGAAARRIASETGIEYIVTEHSSEILNGIQSARDTMIARGIYSDAREVIAVSDILAERISHIAPAAKVRVVGNLVRNSVFDIGRHQGQDPERISIVSIGGLTPNKRIHQAIAALGRLSQPLKARVDYWVVGDGPDRKKLEGLALQHGINAVFCGNIAHHAAMKVLARADIFLHASAFETFGVVLAEAMALGVPVVATRSGGPESFITDVTGRLVEVGDVEAMAYEISNIIVGIEGWRARHAAIVIEARKRFHEAVIALKIAESYQ